MFIVLLLLLTSSYLIYRYSSIENHFTYNFVCPVPAEYCDSGKIITSKGNYLGIGYQLPEGTPIIAIFAGQASSFGSNYKTETGWDHYAGIELNSLNNEYVANYIRINDSLEIKSNFDQSETMATTQSGDINDYGVNLLITVSQNGNIIELKPSDFN